MRKSPLFSQIHTGEAAYDSYDRATYNGITLKTCILLGVAIIVACMVAFALPEILAYNWQLYTTMLVISSVVGIVAVIVGRLSENAAKYASIIYAICEGLFLGSVSAICEAYIPGVVTTAIFSTIVLFAVMLVLFGTGVLRVGNRFRTLCYALTLGALAILLLVGLFSFFMDYQTYLGIMIGVEVFLLFYGVITLLLNFSEANYVVASGASKNAEWSVALGLLVSIIYIYLEALRLIALIVARNSDN